MLSYDGDVKMLHDHDGGYIQIDHGQPTMDEGLATAIYISLFAGPYWGNTASSPDEVLASEIQAQMLKPLTNQTRLDMEAKVRQALQWMIDSGISSEITVEAVISAPGIMEISITTAEGGNIVYQINWAKQAAMTEASA